MSRVGRDGVELFWPRKRERLELQDHAPLVFWNLVAAPPAHGGGGHADRDPGIKLAFLGIRRRMMMNAGTSDVRSAEQALRA